MSPIIPISVNVESMKTTLTQELLKEHLHYNLDTGVFTWIKGNGKSVNAGDEVHTTDKFGYKLIRIFGKNFKQHRLAFLYMTDDVPAIVDHINGIKGDNRWCNLRKANTFTNQQNKRLQKNNRFGMKGVYYRKDRKMYQATIQVNKLSMRVGSYKTPEEAHIAYCFAALEYHKEFAAA